MLWWLGAALFLCLALREVYHAFVPRPGFLSPEPVSWPYLLIALGLALGLAWVPWRTLQFERFLTAKARVLSGVETASVHCNTFFDTMVDPMAMATGHANPDTGEIVLQKPWCAVLRRHLQRTENMDPDGIFSVLMFAHEAMHIRGERNEAAAECQAIQRYVRTALLLGVTDRERARAAGLRYFHEFYPRRQGGWTARYYTDQCAPGKAMDERLPDSIWAP